MSTQPTNGREVAQAVAVYPEDLHNHLTAEAYEKFELIFVGAQERFTNDPIAKAVELIDKAVSEQRWDTKEPWLKFKTTDARFANMVRSRLMARNRTRFGMSHSIEVKVVNVYGEAAYLYVNTKSMR